MDRKLMYEYRQKITEYTKTNPRSTPAQVAEATGVPVAFINALIRLIAKHKANSLATRQEDVAMYNDGSDFYEPLSTYRDDPTGEFETDFDHVMQDVAKASVHEDGTPSSDLYTQAKTFQLQADRVEALAPPVRITPQTARGSAVLGGQGIITSGIEKSQFVFWQGPDEQAQTFTVALSRPLSIANGFPTSTVQSGLETLAYSYRPYARIRWGSRDFAHEVVVDLGRGLQFTAAGSSVYVDVGMDPKPAGNYADGTMLVGATVGFFASHSEAPVTRTVYIDGLAKDVASSPVVIPKFAQAFQIILTPNGDNTGAAIGYGLFDTAGNVIGGQTFYGLSGMMNPTWLPNDAYSIVVQQSNSSDAPANIRIIFQLCV